MFAQPLIGQQGFFRVVVLSQLLLVGKKVVDAIVAEAADHNPAALHFLLLVAALEAAPAMDGSRYQMMPGEGPHTST